MPRGKKFTAEQIIGKLREAEVALAQGEGTAGVSAAGRNATDLLPLEEGVRRSSSRPSEAVEGIGKRECSSEASIGRCGVGQVDSQGSSFGKLLSPAKRRRAVQHVRDALGHARVSERRACRVLSQPRSTQRRQRTIPHDEPRLVRRLIQFASDYGRYGYRRVTVLLRAEGWKVNHKRVARLWRREGLKVPQKQPKRKRL